MQGLWTFIKLMLILPEKQEIEFQEKLNEIFNMEEHTYNPEDKAKLYDLAQVFHRATTGKTFEELMNEQLSEKQQEFAIKFLKAGVSAQIVAFSLNLPKEKIVEIQRQLNMGKA